MKTKELRREVRGWGVRCLPTVLGSLPEPWGRALCAAIGRAAHSLVGRDRRLARANLSRVHPDWTEAEVKRAARRVFEEIGRNAYDFLRYPALSSAARDRLFVWRGVEHLDAVRAAGRGAVVVTGHLGSWEVLAAAMVGKGYPLRSLARPLREPRLEQLLSAHRKRMGVETYASDALSPAALRHLRRGGFLGILMDHRVKRGGVEVRFLGCPTRMADGPARVALAAGVPLVVVGIRRLSDRRHLAEILPPLDPDGFRDAAAITQALASRVESLIAAAPEQWMWIHPRWEPRRGDARSSASSAQAPLPEPGEEERACVAL